MHDALTEAADEILRRSVAEPGRVPGVVAMATDRQANIYEGSAGVRAVGQDDLMRTDDVFAIFSTTKAVTGTAVLQLVEEGKLDLDAPAKDYVPELGEIGVLVGFNASGEPRTRPPRRDITTRMLLLHTAGFGYDFFNQHYFDLVNVARIFPSVISATLASLKTPLLFDPGQEWEYGSNVDWAGQVVEHVAGKRLGEVMQERIFEPLEMHDTAFSMTPSMRARLAAMHQRGEDGSLTPSGFVLPPEAEVQMGGHGLHATVGDYMKFIRMWLNDGAGEQGRVLRSETVRMAEQNGLGDLKIKALPNPSPTISNAAEFFHGMPNTKSL